MVSIQMTTMSKDYEEREIRLGFRNEECFLNREEGKPVGRTQIRTSENKILY